MNARRSIPGVHSLISFILQCNSTALSELTISLTRKKESGGNKFKSRFAALLESESRIAEWRGAK